MRIQKIEVMVATPDDGEPLDIGILQSYLRLQSGKVIEVMGNKMMTIDENSWKKQDFYDDCADHIKNYRKNLAARWANINADLSNKT